MKRVFALVLSLLFVFSAAFSAHAAELSGIETAEKVVFKDENWAYEKLSGYGYEIDEYIGSGDEVELPWSFAKEYVTAIGDYAFLNNISVTSLETTSVIESIGKYAFYGCTGLESIKLYDSLNKIGEGCFYGDTALRNISLEDTTVAEVSAYCFARSGIMEIALPESCTSIGSMAFYNCADLKKIVVPESVTEIADNTFMDSDNVVIYCYTDSYAHEYADANGIEYVLIDAPIEVTFKLGDTDGDGVITVMDATAIQRILVDLDPDEDGMKTLRGTVVEGEALNITHATKIQRYLADYDVEEPIDEEVTRTIIPEN